jgi:hypothetical protein
MLALFLFLILVPVSADEMYHRVQDDNSWDWYPFYINISDSDLGGTAEANQEDIRFYSFPSGDELWQYVWENDTDWVMWAVNVTDITTNTNKTIRMEWNAGNTTLKSDKSKVTWYVRDAESGGSFSDHWTCNEFDIVSWDCSSLSVASDQAHTGTYSFKNTDGGAGDKGGVFFINETNTSVDFNNYKIKGWVRLTESTSYGGVYAELWGNIEWNGYDDLYSYSRAHTRLATPPNHGMIVFDSDAGYNDGYWTNMTFPEDTWMYRELWREENTIYGLWDNTTHINTKSYPTNSTVDWAIAGAYMKSDNSETGNTWLDDWSIEPYSEDAKVWQDTLAPANLTITVILPNSLTKNTEIVSGNATVSWVELTNNYSTNYTLYAYLNDSLISTLNGTLDSRDTDTWNIGFLDVYDGVFEFKVNGTETNQSTSNTDSVTFEVDLYFLNVTYPVGNGTYNNTLTTYFNATCYRSTGNSSFYFWNNTNIYNSSFSISCPSSEIVPTSYQHSEEGQTNITITLEPYDARETELNESFWYYSDLYSPVGNSTRNLYEGFRNNNTESYTFQFNDSFSANFSCALSINSDSYNETFLNSSTYVYNYTLQDGTNTMTINCTDLAGNYIYDSDTHSPYLKYFILIDETTGGNFSLNDANVTVVASNHGESLDMNSDSQIWKYWVSNSSELLRFEFTYEGYEDIIIRNFDTEVMYNSTYVCASPLTNFYEQIMYSSTSKDVYVKNQFANCYLVSDSTKYAYSGALMTFAHSRSAFYYLYVTFDGSTVYLASIEGGTASQIDLDLLRYNRIGWSITLGQDSLSASKIGNQTLYIYYKNNAGDASELNFEIYDGDSEIFDHTETSSPNEFNLYFDYSTMTINNDPLKIVITKTLEDGSEITFTKYISLSGDVGTLPKEVSIFLAFGILVFSLTLVAKGSAIGWVGALASLVGLAFLSFSTATWEVLLMEVAFTAVLIFAVMLQTTQNKKTKVY